MSGLRIFGYVAGAGVVSIGMTMVTLGLYTGVLVMVAGVVAWYYAGQA